MAVLPILELPNPILRQRAKKIRSIDSNVVNMAHDMVDTMRHANGVGLAANQIGQLRRLIVIQLPDEDEARIYINPEITRRSGRRRVEEGCLSIPGYRGFVERSIWIKFRALDQTTKVVSLKAEDLLCQVLEHEVDHLNGILYVDHLESHEDLIPISSEETNETSGEDVSIHSEPSVDSTSAAGGEESTASFKAK